MAGAKKWPLPMKSVEVISLKFIGNSGEPHRLSFFMLISLTIKSRQFLRTQREKNGHGRQGVISLIGEL
jgi:hypothetical protein